jgi:hypothetical protein
MSIILATQETEIRRIMVQNQPWKIVHDTLAQKKFLTKKGWWCGSRYKPSFFFKPHHTQKKKFVFLIDEEILK